MYRNMNNIEYIEIINKFKRYQFTPAPKNDRVLYVRQAIEPDKIKICEAENFLLLKYVLVRALKNSRLISLQKNT